MPVSVLEGEAFSATMMLLRKTSAVIALLGVVVVLSLEFELALMVSLRWFTEEREMRRIGLSFDKRIGLRFGMDGGMSCGKDPGIMNFLKACFRLDPEKRLDREYRFDDD